MSKPKPATAMIHLPVGLGKSCPDAWIPAIIVDKQDSSCRTIKIPRNMLNYSDTELSRMTMYVCLSDKVNLVNSVIYVY